MKRVWDMTNEEIKALTPAQSARVVAVSCIEEKIQLYEKMAQLYGVSNFADVIELRKIVDKLLVEDVIAETTGE